ncbi:hypothetical protein HZH66_011056 [Vespula vulgaris]|uniref:Uncharacterized protein n=1 Tax=Vespula vulgaris TaxID=7454 RepID=A0A834JDX0_VESVU|nr:hypothetical protein HZH66_011056 [Vespula vulgaris]
MNVENKYLVAFSKQQCSLGDSPMLKRKADAEIRPTRQSVKSSHGRWQDEKTRGNSRSKITSSPFEATSVLLGKSSDVSTTEGPILKNILDIKSLAVIVTHISRY